MIREKTLVIFLFILLFFGGNRCFSQFRNDSNLTSEPIYNASPGNEQIIAKEYEEALNYLNRSLPDLALETLFSILREINDENDQYYQIQISIAEAYRQKREYEKGIHLIYSVLNELRNSNSHAEVYAYTRLAALYNEMPNSGNYRDSVIKYSELAIDISKAMNYQAYLALSSNELGYVQKRLNNTKRALELYQVALDIYDELAMYRHAAGVRLNISSVYFDKGDYESAIQILDSAISQCSEDKDANILMRLYLHKSSMLSQTGNCDDAYFFLDKARKMQTNFFNDRIDDRILDVSAKYDLQLKNAKLIEERLINEKRERNIRVLIGVVIILILFSIGIIFLFRLKRKALRQEKQLVELESDMIKTKYQLKNKELVNVLVNSVAEKKILGNVKSLIEKGETKEALKTINLNNKIDAEWKQFVINFSQLHPEFFVKLEYHHPNLNDGEIKLCAFLKMNLTSREISTLLNIELSSVNKKRQRLRKRLGLEREADIGEYLNSI